MFGEVTGVGIFGWLIFHTQNNVFVPSGCVSSAVALLLSQIYSLHVARCLQSISRSVISCSEAAKMPTGRWSIILTGWHGSTISLNLRAFHHCLLTWLEGLHKETCHWIQKLPPSVLDVFSGCQISSPFVTLLLSVSPHKNDDEKKHFSGFPSCSKNFLVLSEWMKFDFGQKHCQGFWFWFIYLTNVSSADAAGRVILSYSWAGAKTTGRQIAPETPSQNRCLQTRNFFIFREYGSNIVKYTMLTKEDSK